MSRVEQASQQVLSTTAISEIIDNIFRQNANKSVEDHLAAKREMVLASNGQIATRRVIDRTPMINWEVFRSLTSRLGYKSAYGVCG